MANLIQVTPEELRNRARDVRQYRSQNDEVMTDISILIRSLNDIWEGEAQRAYEAKLSTLQSKFNEFSDKIEAYAKMMDMTADGLEQTDIRISSAINSFNI
ncbi:WXG100 family type VII secretion target [Candidatus Epulonipiscium viviparus]|uniref:WXG100 family type VII secretion target n=1 Tax=Candidatus Epulonipiscium viviparus TaxID=420336 RepID=UPI00016C09D5|nr:WXG100 family type VII secretion target [Candidatus Epulopiscium viviparus]